MNDSQMMTLRRMFDDDPEGVIKFIFSQEFWLPSLKTQQGYGRFEDDSMHGCLEVFFLPDGDGAIMVTSKPDPHDPHMAFRFRMPMIGGGESDRTRKALMILALAIKLDNEAWPQNREPQV